LPTAAEVPAQDTASAPEAEAADTAATAETVAVGIAAATVPTTSAADKAPATATTPDKGTAVAATPATQTATTPAPVPTPAKPAAPARKVYKEGSGVKPAIGDTGPGGGTIFAVNGFSYKEVSQPLGKVEEAEKVSGVVGVPAREKIKAYRGGGLSDWYQPHYQEMEQIVANLGRTGKADFGKDYFFYNSMDFFSPYAAVGAKGMDIPGFPGYQMFYAGGGWRVVVRLSDGQLYDLSPGNLKTHNTVAVRIGLGPEVKTYKIGDTGAGGGIVVQIPNNGNASAYREIAIIGEVKAEPDDNKLIWPMIIDYKGGGLSDWELCGEMDRRYLQTAINATAASRSRYKDAKFWAYVGGDMCRIMEAKQEGDTLTLTTSDTLSYNGKNSPVGQTFTLAVVRESYGAVP
jgi:hypothetical protein